MPQAVKTIFGYALFKAQVGEEHPDAKPMRGFGGAAKVTEVVVDDEADTYRTMYTVELGGYVFVLHSFKKKSTSGKSTPKAELDVIERRLKDATELYERWKKESKS